ncbi:MAG: hypothetical protein JWM34_3247 [Ilumatobacteraceae bacterium]|nr:hypothetical protein [Ilumatobacteraceae bacterium]
MSVRRATGGLSAVLFPGAAAVLALAMISWAVMFNTAGWALSDVRTPGVANKGIDDLAPGTNWELVTHAVDHDEFGFRDRCGSGLPAAETDERIVGAMNDDRWHPEQSKVRSAIAAGDDRVPLPQAACRMEGAIERRSSPTARGGLIEREPASDDEATKMNSCNQHLVTCRRLWEGHRRHQFL